MMDYAAMLERGFEDRRSAECGPESRLEYLAEAVFDFTTYDGGMSELFATKALEVCAAINSGKTFAYIEDPGNYQWFLLMVNMPFFAGKLNWGTSIRGAWWDHDKIEAECDLWDRGTMIFDREEWEGFIAALIAFAAQETKQAPAAEATGAKAAV